MSDIEFVELRKIAENATPGPWEAFEDSNEHLADCPPTMEWLVTATDPGEEFCEEIIDWGNRGRREDAEFIATFNPDRVLGLLDRLEQAEAALQRVRELHRECDFYRETCAECSAGDNLVDWPCPTIRALEGDE